MTDENDDSNSNGGVAQTLLAILGGLLGTLISMVCVTTGLTHPAVAKELERAYQKETTAQTVDVPGILWFVREQTSKDMPNSNYIYYSYDFPSLDEERAKEDNGKQSTADSLNSYGTLDTFEKPVSVDLEENFITAPNKHGARTYEKVFSTKTRPHMLSPKNFTVRVLTEYPASGVPKVMVRNGMFETDACMSTTGGIVAFLLSSTSVWFGMFRHGDFTNRPDNALSFLAVLAVCAVVTYPTSASWAQRGAQAWKEGILTKEETCPASMKCLPEIRRFQAMRPGLSLVK